MKTNSCISVFCAAATFLFACAKQVTRTPDTAVTISSRQIAKPLEYVKRTKKDTLTYIVEFHDSLQRGQFGKDLEKLIKTFPTNAPVDTTRAFFIKTQAVEAAPQFLAGAPVQPVAPVPAQPPAQEKPPVRTGGAVTIYTPFGSLDQTMPTLTQAFLCRSELCPMRAADSIAATCLIKALSDKKVAVTLSSGMQNAAGKGFSAFDAVTLWSAYIKQHPAEGRALFRHVNGIDQFIAGREAVVPGFQVTDEKTVTLQLSQADPSARQRLCSSRLFPAVFKTGPYYIKNDKNNPVQLAPNAHCLHEKPFLNSCDVKLGMDNNPFLTFSLNRYDVMEIYSIKDADYARRSFSDKATLISFAECRYFLSLAFQSPELRIALCRLFDRKDMLVNYVKAEGSALSSVESTEENIDALTPPAPVLANIPSSLAVIPITVLFRNDDPVSAIIADKLLADISRAGMNCTVKGTAAEEYEKALVKKDYGIAVGSVPASIVRDQSERLRMAAIWFNDETNERTRIDQKLEFPLFSIKTYLLCKNKIGFLNNTIESMYVKE
jgi:hypothetical protein